MKLQAKIDSKPHDIEIIHSDDKVSGEIDGRSFELEVSEPEPNVFVLKNEGKIFEVFVSPQKDAGGPFQVKVGTNEVEITVTDPKRLRGSAAGAEDASGKVEIKTAMPGKVVRILKSVGDSVEKGDGVIVVEAMKMQNEMKSPKDGVIQEIRVAESDTVGAGDVLVVIE